MALQPAFGQFYRLFSVRYIFLACVVVFEAGSVFCALAPSSLILTIGQVITAVGGGGLYIGSVVLFGYAVPYESRATYSISPWLPALMEFHPLRTLCSEGY
ncbi:hypothetical protein F4803DRAFT_535870 [Xylaria telfairii]|nr:hypothetical protein F4803DRAFT_535870 [Xylaria telfairii]